MLRFLRRLFGRDSEEDDPVLAAAKVTAAAPAPARSKPSAAKGRTSTPAAPLPDDPLGAFGVRTTAPGVRVTAAPPTPAKQSRSKLPPMRVGVSPEEAREEELRRLMALIDAAIATSVPRVVPPGWR